MSGARLLDNIPQRGVSVGVDVRRHAGRVLLQPISIHVCPCATRSLSMRYAQFVHALRATLNGVEATPSDSCSLREQEE
jgi:hypothetical protein